MSAVEIEDKKITETNMQLSKESLDSLNSLAKKDSKTKIGTLYAQMMSLLEGIVDKSI